MIGLGRFVEAETYALSSVSRNPGVRNLPLLIVAQAHLGRFEEAKQSAERLRSLDAFSDVTAFREDLRDYNRSDTFVNAMLEGFDLAGFKDEAE